MKYIWAFLIWLSIVPLAILNGGLRQCVLDIYLGVWSNLVSGVILSVCILALSMLLIPRIKDCHRRDYWIIGAMWVVMTNLFDITLILIGGGSWSDFVEMYDITGGNLWIVVVLMTFFSPVLAGRKMKKMRRYEK